MSISAMRVGVRQMAFEAGYKDGIAMTQRYAPNSESKFSDHGEEPEDYLEGWKFGYRDRMSGLV